MNVDVNEDVNINVDVNENVNYLTRFQMRRPIEVMEENIPNQKVGV